MPTLQSDIAQQDFASGMERDVAPHLIDESGSYDLVDFLLDEDGNPYKRGGSAYLSSAGLGSSGLTWLWDGYLGPGRRTVFANNADFGVLDGANAPVNLGGAGLTVPAQAAAIEDYLFIGGSAIYAGSRKSASYSTGTVSLTNGATTVTGVGTSFTANVDAGMLLQFGSERVYRVASVTDNTHLEIAEAYEGTTKAGSAYTLTPLYSITGPDPYQSDAAVTVCSNKLVTGSSNVVRFTALSPTTGRPTPHTFGANDYHTLPEGANVLGLGTVGQTVLIFTTAGVWTLDGLPFDIVDANGAPQHRLQQLSRDVVLATSSSLATYGQALVVPATYGVYLMDGVSEPQRVSRPIEKLYRRWIDSGYIVGQPAVHRGHLFLPLITLAATVKDLLVCRLDRPTHSRAQVAFPWTRLSGDGGNIPAFAGSNDASTREPILLGAQKSTPSRILDCSGYFDPTSVNKLDADGSTFFPSIVTRDYETGGLTENVVRKVRGRYELVDAGSDDPLLAIAYATGARETGAPVWGDPAGVWGVGFGPSGTDTWTDGVDAEFDTLPCSWSESDGRRPQACRVGKRTRYIRFKIVLGGPAASFALRSLELFIRPSAAGRR